MNSVTNVFELWSDEDNCASACACGIIKNFQNNHNRNIHDSFKAFGEGLGEGSICGCLLGSIAAITKILSDEGIDDYNINHVVNELKIYFKSKFKEINCGDLLIELKNKDGKINFESPKRLDKCSNIIKETVEFAEKLIFENININEPISSMYR